jgi:glycolate oxidase iron-sulfur subunit
VQTRIDERYRDSAAGREADAILRSCVHCGFCSATCPTYQLLGDELDGPRGRIYLIKQMLEGQTVSARTQLHLDRCLTCRACETTCPSGVRYGHLVEIGRALVEQQVPRPRRQRLLRFLLRKWIAYPRRFSPLLRLGQTLRPLLPKGLRGSIPQRQKRTQWPRRRHPRRMLVLGGCVQSVATPHTNAAAARVLDRLGIELIDASTAGCCGAVSYHLSAHGEALDFMRRNIDAWWPYIEEGIEAIVVTASGCGALVKDYGYLLAADAGYAEKARRVSMLTRDLSEVLSDAELAGAVRARRQLRVAFHSPCTLQHGQCLDGVVEAILTRAGFTLTSVADAHLCCGSAGTYSILQPELSQRLLDNKLACLEQDPPDVIATANVGCQMHLASRAAHPVRHWIELIDEAMRQGR